MSSTIPALSWSEDAHHSRASGTTTLESDTNNVAQVQSEAKNDPMESNANVTKPTMSDSLVSKWSEREKPSKHPS